jgi:hypothetical protein
MFSEVGLQKRVPDKLEPLIIFHMNIMKRYYDWITILVAGDLGEVE